MDKRRINSRLELYCRIPFNRTKANNHEIQLLASLIDRTPAAVARKLGNYGAFDPVLQKRHVSGLTHGSRQDKEVWDEFHHDWSGLVSEAYRIRKTLGDQPPMAVETDPPIGPSEKTISTKQRLHQWFFRKVILSSYGARCCITGIAITECLVASHIVPWSRDERYRTDPQNGLCLSATFDRLFDCGLITISDDLTITVSSRLQSLRDQATQQLVCVYGGKSISLPHRFSPSSDHLQWHRCNVFLG